MNLCIWFEKSKYCDIGKPTVGRLARGYFGDKGYIGGSYRAYVAKNKNSYLSGCLSFYRIRPPIL